jgi:hypothetical protein
MDVSTNLRPSLCLQFAFKTCLGMNTRHISPKDANKIIKIVKALNWNCMCGWRFCRNCYKYCLYVCMYTVQTNTHLIDSSLYCSIFIAPTCFNANASSSGSSYSVPAKLHEHVHAVLVVFFKKLSDSLFRIVKTFKHKGCLSYNKLYCNNSREFSRVAVCTICKIMDILIVAWTCKYYTIKCRL